MNPELDPIEPEGAVEMYLTVKHSEFADATLRSHRSRLRRFVQWCNEQNLSNLNRLTGRDLHRYRLWCREDGDLSLASEKTQMDTIRVFIRWAESVDAVQPDLSEKVISPTLTGGDNVRDVMVDAKEAEQILDHKRSFVSAYEILRGAIRGLVIGRIGLNS